MQQPTKSNPTNTRSSMEHYSLPESDVKPSINKSIKISIFNGETHRLNYRKQFEAAVECTATTEKTHCITEEEHFHRQNLETRIGSHQSFHYRPSIFCYVHNKPILGHNV